MITVFTVLLIVLTIKFMFCGIAKLWWYRETISFATKFEYFPDKLGRIMGVILPWFEIFIFMMLLMFNSVYIYIVISCYFLLFIALNIKAIAGRKDISCFCYGKLIRSRLGFGGLFNFLCHFAIVITCSIISNDSLFVVLNNVREHEILPIGLSVIGISWGMLLGQMYGDNLFGRV